MRRIAVPLIASTLLALSGCSTAERTAHDGWNHYGAATEAHAMPEVALGALGDANGAVKITGTIVEVCTIKGCWMKLRDPSSEYDILVRFKDYGFFVPRNANGRTAWVTGHAETVELSVEALRHLAHDAGKSEAEIATISKPRKEVTFLADAVWIQGPGLQDPYRPIGKEYCPEIESGSAATTTPAK